jgi:hypothetical protein
MESVMFRLFLLLIIPFCLHAANTTNGARIYEQYCATCHGSDLQGGMAQSLIDGVWQFGSKDSHVFRNVKFGIPDRGMPGFEGSMSDQDVKDDRVIHEEVILKNLGRVRDVCCGPDGAIYVVLNQPGMIIRLSPAE